MPDEVITAAEYRRRMGLGTVERRSAGQVVPIRSGPQPNNLEARFAIENLDRWKEEGLVESYHFEAIKLRLATRTFYTPDYFVVWTPKDGQTFGRITIEEVKGYWREDARVKFKVAAALYPRFAFRAWTHNRRAGWRMEAFR